MSESSRDAKWLKTVVITATSAEGFASAPNTTDIAKKPHRRIRAI
jgi:hypothetical protein